MALPEAGAGAGLPVLVVRGSHAGLGRAIGERQREQIALVVVRAQEGFRERGTSEAEIREQNAPYVGAAARIYPGYLTELEAMAEGAGVPFDVLFRLNCYEAYPPGTRPLRPGSRLEAPPAPPAAPLPLPREAEGVPTKDPAEMAVANDPAAVASTPADGCTSVASKGAGGVVVGHTEDSSPEAIAGMYLLDARVDTSPVTPGAQAGQPGRQGVEPGARPGRFLALNYAQTLPGCAAAVNEAGLIVLIDALPDPDRRVGAPRHMVSRALLDLPSIEAAVEHLRQTERGGGWNYLLVQGERIVNVEATATRLVVHEAGPSGAYAHANHYLDPVLAADTGDPRPNSITRLSRALELVTPGMDTAQMKTLLGDKLHFPDSICRERTVAAFVADTAARQVQLCWGEPDGATWTAYTY